MQPNHRLAIQGMTAGDAIDYLLSILDGDQCRVNQDKCDFLHRLGNPAIPTTALALLMRLHASNGRVVTYDALSAVAEYEIGMHNRAITRLDLSAHVKRIRYAIRRHGWPVTITAVYGIGYLLESDGWLVKPRPAHCQDIAGRGRGPSLTR